MKILIADDERMVRLGIISMLEELYPSAHTYIEAKNGKEVVSLVREHSPVIAFVDIKMPLVNGLDAIREAGKCSVMTKWVMLTGYPEFDYVKQAISLGVVDYLVKPASVEELHAVMQKTIESLRTEQEGNLARFRHDITALYFHDSPRTPTHKDVEGSGYYAQAVLFPDFPQKEKKTELFNRLESVLHSGMYSFSDFSARYALFTIHDKEICLVFYGGKETAAELFGRIDMIKVEYERCGLPMTVYTAAQKATQSEIYYAYLETLRIASLRCVRGFGSVMRLEDYEQSEELGYLLSFSHNIVCACDAFLKKDEMAYKSAVDNLRCNRVNRNAFHYADTESLQRYLKVFMQVNIPLSTFDIFLKGMSNSIDIIYEKPAPRTGNDTITKILEYVRENYMKDIGIKSIADILDITPNYLSTLFHEATHQKFTDYISSVRITQAKKLLADNPSISIKEVAQQVGYVSVRHFTRVFLRYASVYPSDFRDHTTSMQKAE